MNLSLPTSFVFLKVVPTFIAAEVPNKFLTSRVSLEKMNSKKYRKNTIGKWVSYLPQVVRNTKLTHPVSETHKQKSSKSL